MKMVDHAFLVVMEKKHIHVNLIYQKNIFLCLLFYSFFLSKYAFMQVCFNIKINSVVISVINKLSRIIEICL